MATTDAMEAADSEKQQLDAAKSEWKREHELRLKQEADAHDARLRDVDDVIRHRKVIEEGQARWLDLIASGHKLQRRAVEAEERIATALESLAKKWGEGKT